jgi:hypothetical protein
MSFPVKMGVSWRSQDLTNAQGDEHQASCRVKHFQKEGMKIAHCIVLALIFRGI